MHDRVDAMRRHQSRYQREVAHVGDHQLTGSHRLAKTLAEVIDDHHPFAGFAQLTHDVAADVAGAAGDEDASVGHWVRH